MFHKGGLILDLLISEAAFQVKLNTMSVTHEKIASKNLFF